MIQLYTDKISDLHAHSIFSDGNLSILGSIMRRKDMIHQIEEIGISDHFRAITEHSWEAYVDEFEKCKMAFNCNTMKILLGIEVFAADVDNLTMDHFNILDYIIVENFEDFYHLEDYQTLICRLKQSFNGRIILAHPELDKIYENLGKSQFIELLNFLKERFIPLEVNVNNGYWFNGQYDVEKIFSKETEEMTLMNEFGALVSIGTDSHLYEDSLFENFENVMWLLSENGGL